MKEGEHGLLYIMLSFDFYVHGLYATKVKYSHVIYPKDASMKEGAKS